MNELTKPAQIIDDYCKGGIIPLKTRDQDQLSAYESTINLNCHRVASIDRKIKIKIALIAFVLPEDSFEKKQGQLCNKATGQVVKTYSNFIIKQNKLDTHAKNFLAAISKACAREADIICCNEMSFPLYGDSKKNQKIRNSLKTFSKDRVIISGSFHDFIGSGCNIAQSYVSGEKIIEQQKLVPSRTLEKDITPALTRELQIICSDIGTYCVSICYDIYSADVGDSYLFIKGKNEIEKIDMIFVPSYDPTFMKNIKNCKRLHNQTGITVLCVNDMSFFIPPSVFTEGAAKKPNDVIETKYFKIYLFELNLKNIRKHRNNMVRVVPD